MTGRRSSSIFHWFTDQFRAAGSSDWTLKLKSSPNMLSSKIECVMFIKRESPLSTIDRSTRGIAQMIKAHVSTLPRLGGWRISDSSEWVHCLHLDRAPPQYRQHSRMFAQPQPVRENNHASTHISQFKFKLISTAKFKSIPIKCQAVSYRNRNIHYDSRTHIALTKTFTLQASIELVDHKTV